MIREQRTDDAGLRIRAIWLGPSGSWRWPFDATYAQWSIGAGLTVIFTGLLWLVLPAAIPLGLCAAALSRRVARQIAPTRTGVATGGIVALWVLLGLLVAPSVRTWVTPMPLLAALAAAPALAFLVTWRVGKQVTGERPVGYWLALPGRIARGPRRGASTEIDPALLALTPDAPYRQLPRREVTR